MEIERLLNFAEDSYVREEYYDSFDYYLKAYKKSEELNDSRKNKIYDELRFAGEIVFYLELDRADEMIAKGEYILAEKILLESKKYIFYYNDLKGLLYSHLVVLCKNKDDEEGILKNAECARENFKDMRFNQANVMALDYVLKVAADVYNKKGKYDKAISYLLDGLKLLDRCYPENIVEGLILKKEYFIRLSDLYKKTGDKKKQLEFEEMVENAEKW